MVAAATVPMQDYLSTFDVVLKTDKPLPTAVLQDGGNRRAIGVSGKCGQYY